MKLSSSVAKSRPAGQWRPAASNFKAAPIRGAGVRVNIAAPERATAASPDLDNAERARLEQTDAFAELKKMNEAKQTVNRPQKVGRWGGAFGLRGLERGRRRDASKSQITQAQAADTFLGWRVRVKSCFALH